MLSSASRRHNFLRQQRRRRPLLSSPSSAAAFQLRVAVVLALCVVSGSGSPLVPAAEVVVVPVGGEAVVSGSGSPEVVPVGGEAVVSGSGSPVGGGEASGADPDDAPLSTSPFWRALISATAGHQNQFKEEFLSNIKYQSLEEYNLPSFPAGCPNANFSKESCLRRLVQGLLRYRVLLNHVESQYGQNPILPEARFYGERLTSLLRSKMRRPEPAGEQSGDQEEGEEEERTLLGAMSDPAATTEFHRKLTAHAVLRHMHLFLIDGQRALSRREVRASRKQQQRPGSTSQLL